jgi:hypothetical protein
VSDWSERGQSGAIDGRAASPHEHWPEPPARYQLGAIILMLLVLAALIVLPW